MGWKYTETISREEAIFLILKRLRDMTNRQLADAVEAVGYGDTSGIEYYGANFCVVDEVKDKEDKEED
jgi:hypothetical protein